MPEVSVYVPGAFCWMELGTRPPQLKDMGSVWRIYVAVDDCDGTADKAQAAGAKLLAPPSEVPGVGRMAAFRDPQGAMLSVIRLNA
jgi:predicted enzyme related to lactoylglutathione lyase